MKKLKEQLKSFVDWKVKYDRYLFKIILALKNFGGVFLLAIKSYTNSILEKKILEMRLKILMDRKEKIYNDCLLLKDKNDFVKYAYELSKKSSITGKSIKEEITDLKEEKEKLEKTLFEMEKGLEGLNGVAKELFTEIVFNGLKPTKAVEKVATNKNMSINNVWKNHYRKIMPQLEKLKN